MVLEELRVLHLDLKTARWSIRFKTGRSLSIGALKARPHNDTLPSTRPHLLIVPFPMGQAFKHMNLWRPHVFKPPQIITDIQMT